MLEKLGREREEALLPGPIKGLAQFMLRIDTKVMSLAPPLPGSPPPLSPTLAFIYLNTLVDYKHDIRAAVVTVAQVRRYLLWDKDKDRQCCVAFSGIKTH